mmetsp:Transcript_16404/g.27788  ORF Transcript_16404/g.27788 Transcript_16404/m.27788 type:complete len:144 (+) Transcript_16404:1795-2226(+)
MEGEGDLEGDTVGLIPVGSGDGLGDCVGTSDGFVVVGEFDGDGDGAGDAEGFDVSTIGKTGPNVGSFDGWTDAVGRKLGEGLGFGEAVGNSDGVVVGAIVPENWFVGDSVADADLKAGNQAVSLYGDCLRRRLSFGGTLHCRA